MKVVITGGGGMLGFKLARALLARASLTSADGKEAAITQLTLSPWGMSRVLNLPGISVPVSAIRVDRRCIGTGP